MGSRDRIGEYGKNRGVGGETLVREGIVGLCGKRGKDPPLVLLLRCRCRRGAPK